MINPLTFLRMLFGKYPEGTCGATDHAYELDVDSIEWSHEHQCFQLGDKVGGICQRCGKTVWVDRDSVILAVEGSNA